MEENIIIACKIANPQAWSEVVLEGSRVRLVQVNSLGTGNTFLEN